MQLEACKKMYKPMDARKRLNRLSCWGYHHHFCLPKQNSSVGFRCWESEDGAAVHIFIGTAIGMRLNGPRADPVDAAGCKGSRSSAHTS